MTRVSGHVTSLVVWCKGQDRKSHRPTFFKYVLDTYDTYDFTQGLHTVETVKQPARKRLKLVMGLGHSTPLIRKGRDFHSCRLNASRESLALNNDRTYR